MIEVIVASCQECGKQFFMRYDAQTVQATETEIVQTVTGEISQHNCGCLIGAMDDM